MHSNPGTTVPSSIGQKIENGGIAIKTLMEISEGYEHLARVFVRDITDCYELIEVLYLKSNDELLASSDNEALYARSLNWFEDSITEVVDRGYNVEMFFCGVSAIGRAATNGENVNPAERSIFREACGIITSSIWDSFASYEESDEDIEGP